MGFDQVMETTVVVLGTPTVCWLFWVWGLDEVWGRVRTQVRSRRKPKPTGWDGKIDPIEDLVQHKDQMREARKKEWFEEWVASLSVAERREIDELYEEHVLELRTYVPHAFEARLRRDYLNSEVEDRIKHLAAGRPDLIARPGKAEPQRDHATDTRVTGAVLSTGSGMGISAQGVILPGDRSGPTVVPPKVRGHGIRYADGRTEYFTLPTPPAGPSGVSRPKPEKSTSEREQELQKQVDELLEFKRIIERKAERLAYEGSVSVTPEELARQTAKQLAWLDRVRPEMPLF